MFVRSRSADRQRRKREERRRRGDHANFISAHTFTDGCQQPTEDKDAREGHKRGLDAEQATLKEAIHKGCKDSGGEKKGKDGTSDESETLLCPLKKGGKSSSQDGISPLAQLTCLFDWLHTLCLYEELRKPVFAENRREHTSASAKEKKPFRKPDLLRLHV